MKVTIVRLGSCHVSDIKMEDILVLEETFAYLSDEGWLLPLWLQILRNVALANN